MVLEKGRGQVMAEAFAAFVILGWIVLLLAVAYRAGRESKACCFRHGHDAPKIPPPKLPGMYLKPTRIRVQGDKNAKTQVVYVSKAAERG